MDYLEEAIDTVSQRVAEMLAPVTPAIKVLVSIPGIERRTAEVVVAEIGTDMSRFATSRHLASWAGLSPGNNESAGKRKHGRTTKGSLGVRIRRAGRWRPVVPVGPRAGGGLTLRAAVVGS